MTYTSFITLHLQDVISHYENNLEVRHNFQAQHTLIFKSAIIIVWHVRRTLIVHEWGDRVQMCTVLVHIAVDGREEEGAEAGEDHVGDAECGRSGHEHEERDEQTEQRGDRQRRHRREEVVVVERHRALLHARETLAHSQRAFRLAGHRAREALPQRVDHIARQRRAQNAAEEDEREHLQQQRCRRVLLLPLLFPGRRARSCCSGSTAVVRNTAWGRLEPGHRLGFGFDGYVYWKPIINESKVHREEVEETQQHAGGPEAHAEEVRREEIAHQRLNVLRTLDVSLHIARDNAWMRRKHQQLACALKIWLIKHEIADEGISSNYTFIY